MKFKITSRYYRQYVATFMAFSPSGKRPDLADLAQAVGPLQETIIDTEVDPKFQGATTTDEIKRIFLVQQHPVIISELRVENIERLDES